MKQSNRKVTVMIPGRLKSERLPNKLILKLNKNGDTLWSIACEKLSILQKLGYDVVTLQNDKELEEISNMHNIPTIKRDRNTCLVDGPLDYIFKDLKQVKGDYIMFLNPCLYNLKVETIINSIEDFQNSTDEYATSVKTLKNWLFDKNGKSINKIDYKALNTKTVEKLYQAAHCFHVFNRRKFFEDGHMLKKDHKLLHVKDEETLDVDTAEDFYYAKFRLEE